MTVSQVLGHHVGYCAIIRGVLFLQRMNSKEQMVGRRARRLGYVSSFASKLLESCPGTHDTTRSYTDSSPPCCNKMYTCWSARVLSSPYNYLSFRRTQSLESQATVNFSEHFWQQECESCSQVLGQT